MAAQAGYQKKRSNTPSSSQNIKAVVRVRPLSNDERDKGYKSVVYCNSLGEIQAKEKKFHFDRVFSPDSSQMDIYSFVVAPMINDVLAGYNCTVFAYGQTGTGKTHTMTGGDPTLTSVINWKKDEQAGCIPRAAANIFDELGSMKVIDYNVRVSFLELYNEEVRDLLSHEERPPPLNIFNDNKGSVCIQNLNEITVFTTNDIFMLLQQGTLKRQTAATLMNNHSSRSHTVFTITVHTREANITGDEVLKTGKINLVDLAGSENIAKSGAKDKRAQELANINKSLLTLGRVIQILAEKNNKHVPYRDSKLTRILQDSLGGHTKTYIIATVSPCHTSYEETQNTLEYACRARHIRNTPTVNEKVTKVQMMKEMTHEIEKLRKDLEAARSGDGFFIDRINWDELNSELQSKSSALSLKNDMIREMKDKLTDLETMRDLKEKEFEEAMNVCKHKEKMIDKAESLLRDQRHSLQQEQYLSKCYSEATENLSLIRDVLQKKLENQYLNSHRNEKIINEKSTILSNNLHAAMTELESLNNVTSTSINNQKVNVNSAKIMCKNFACHSKMTWESESRPLVETNFEKHLKLIQDGANDVIERVHKSQEEIDEMVGLVNNSTISATTAYDHFEKYEESSSTKLNLMESFISDLRNNLLNLKDTKLRDLETQIDSMVINIDQSKRLWSDPNSTEDADIKLKIRKNFDGVQQSNQLLSKVLETTSVNLDSQRQSCSEGKQRLTASTLEVKQNVDQAINNVLNYTAAFASDNTLLLDSLEENINSLNQAVEAHHSEILTVLYNTDETGKDIAMNIIPVKRAGDTPLRSNRLSYSKRIADGLSRDVLIQKFKEEFSEDESFHLNLSSDSVVPLDDPDDRQGSYEESLDNSK